MGEGSDDTRSLRGSFAAHIAGEVPAHARHAARDGRGDTQLVGEGDRNPMILQRLPISIFE